MLVRCSVLPGQEIRGVVTGSPVVGTRRRSKGGLVGGAGGAAGRANGGGEASERGG
jgi:hypothetical protein